MDVLAIFFPKEKKFYAMIEDQVKLIKKGTSLFSDYTDSFNKLTPKEKEKYIKKIKRIEKQSDEHYLLMVQALKSTFITPMDREDLHKLVVLFDQAIDSIEQLTGKMQNLKPVKLGPLFIKQKNLYIEMYDKILKLILSIKNEAQAEKLCKLLRLDEEKGDDIYLEAIHVLFSKKNSPEALIKIHELHSTLEEMIDSLNQIGCAIENLVVKYA